MGQKGYVHHVDGIVGACTATDYKDPKCVLEFIRGDEMDKNADINVIGMVRKLTPTEYGRLQGFPMDNWEQVVSNSQAYKQFGNAVTVNVARAIATAIYRFLGKQGG